MKEEGWGRARWPRATQPPFPGWALGLKPFQKAQQAQKEPLSGNKPNRGAWCLAASSGGHAPPKPLFCPPSPQEVASGCGLHVPKQSPRVQGNSPKSRTVSKTPSALYFPVGLNCCVPEALETKGRRLIPGPGRGSGRGQTTRARGAGQIERWLPAGRAEPRASQVPA